jgi:nicotinamide riboside kinase
MPHRLGYAQYPRREGSLVDSLLGRDFRKHQAEEPERENLIEEATDELEEMELDYDKILLGEEEALRALERDVKMT